MLFSTLWQGVGAVGGYKEGLIPRAVAVMHHLIETSQHKGTLVVTQSGKTSEACSTVRFMLCFLTAATACVGVMHTAAVCVRLAKLVAAVATLMAACQTCLPVISV